MLHGRPAPGRRPPAPSRRPHAMSPIRSRRSIPSPATLAVAAALLLPAVTGCGGGTVNTSPATTPPAASSDEVPNAPAPPPGQKLSSGWRYRFDMISPANDNFGVTTREVYLYFRPDTTAVFFQLENRLGIPIDILWDECSFIDYNGRVYRAVHRGVTYDTRDLPQEATHVQPGQRISDFIIPVDLLNDPKAATGLGARLLLPTDLSAQSLVGRTFGPNFVVTAENNEKRNFEVRFKVASVYASDR